MDIDWLATFGVVLYTAGVVKSVVEEWPERGLTDTSYTSLWCWLMGSGALCAWAVASQPIAVGVCGAVPPMIYGYWIGRKLQDGQAVSRRRRC